MRICFLIWLVVFAAPVLGQDDCFFEADKKQEKALSACAELEKSGRINDAFTCYFDLEEEPGIGMEALFRAGRFAYGQEQFKACIKALNPLTDACPAYAPDAWFYLGMSHFYLAEYKEAAQALQSFLDESADNVEMIDLAEESLKKAKLLDEVLNNPVPFDPKPVKDICTELDEYLPIISPDNSIMLFTRGNIRIDKKPYGSEKIRVEDFSISEKQGEHFEEGIPLPKPFNKGLNEGGASITIDNNEIFVTICNAEGGYGSCDIYATQFDGFAWTELANLGAAVNDSNWQSQVSIAADKNTLYFTSDKEGGYGGKDIWIARRGKDGNWSEVVNAGPAINTSFDEQSPFIHPDDNTLYYASNNPEFSIGGYDILILRKSNDGSWTKPKNIGYPINSFENDLGFFVSTDGKTAFFASNKFKGVGGYDVYSFPLYAEARPKKLLFVKGQVLDEQGNVLSDVTIELKDLKTNEIKEIEIDSLTGKYIINEHFENDQLMIVNRDGFFYGSQVIRTEDKDFAAPGKLDFKLQQLKTGGSYKVNNILFDTDSYVIKESSKLELQGLVRFLELNPELKIEIAGHTDDVGDAQSNLELSQNRAKAVRDLVVSSGIDGTRLKFKGYGETLPIASNDTDAGKAKNRRTEVKILGQ